MNSAHRGHLGAFGLGRVRRRSADGRAVDVGVGRLDRITSFFKATPKLSEFPVLWSWIARDGKVVYNEAFGVRDPATGAPMRKDSIFADLYSMTKPVTGGGRLDADGRGQAPPE